MKIKCRCDRENLVFCAVAAKIINRINELAFKKPLRSNWEELQSLQNKLKAHNEKNKLSQNS